MSIGKYAKLIFKQIHRVQDKPTARFVRERKTGNPLQPTRAEIVFNVTIPVLYSETEVISSDAGAIVPKIQMFFYIKKADLPQNTKPVVNDKIIYKDRTYFIVSVSEIADTIYKVTVEYA